MCVTKGSIHLQIKFLERSLHRHWTTDHKNKLEPEALLSYITQIPFKTFANQFQWKLEGFFKNMKMWEGTMLIQLVSELSVIQQQL